MHTEEAESSTRTGAGSSKECAPFWQPIQQEDYHPLIQAASMDRHAVIAPSHVHLNKSGKVSGYLSVSTPSVYFWMHSRESKPREAVLAVAHAERVCKNMGLNWITVPCQASSPYYGHMEKMGYQMLYPTVLFLKELK